MTVYMCCDLYDDKSKFCFVTLPTSIFMRRGAGILLIRCSLCSVKQLPTEHSVSHCECTACFVRHPFHQAIRQLSASVCSLPRSSPTRVINNYPGPGPPVCNHLRAEACSETMLMTCWRWPRTFNTIPCKDQQRAVRTTPPPTLGQPAVRRPA